MMSRKFVSSCTMLRTMAQKWTAVASKAVESRKLPRQPFLMTERICLESDTPLEVYHLPHPSGSVVPFENPRSDPVCE